MKKRYSSLKDIEDDLKILKLKKDIDTLCVKADCQSLIRNLSIRNLLSDTITEIRESFFTKRKSIFSLGAEFLIRRFLNR